MDENVKYVLKKKYTCGLGSLTEGSEIRFLRGACYFDGGMVPDAYAIELKKLINDPKLRDEYISVQKLIYNKV